jgi:hypothetical protein
LQLATGLLACVVIFANVVNTTSAMMAKSTRKPVKPGGQDRPFQMRVSESFLRAVDEWRRRQQDLPSRSEAIRRMVELASRLDLERK